MDVSYDDVGRTKVARTIMVNGRKIRVERRAIEIWQQNPDTVFNAVWNADNREFRLSTPKD